MTSQVPSYHGFRFPPEIINHAIWLDHRFGLSFRDVEDLRHGSGSSTGRPSAASANGTGGVAFAAESAVADALMVPLGVVA